MTTSLSPTAVDLLVYSGGVLAGGAIGAGVGGKAHRGAGLLIGAVGGGLASLIVQQVGKLGTAAASATPSATLTPGAAQLAANATAGAGASRGQLRAVYGMR